MEGRHPKRRGWTARLVGCAVWSAPSVGCCRRRSVTNP